MNEDRSALTLNDGAIYIEGIATGHATFESEALDLSGMIDLCEEWTVVFIKDKYKRRFFDD